MNRLAWRAGSVCLVVALWMSILAWSTSPATAARTLAKTGGLTASVPNRIDCGGEIPITVNARSIADFQGDRVQLQKLVGLLRFALGMECASVRGLRITGRVKGTEVYRGDSLAGSGWILIDQYVAEPALDLEARKSIQSALNDLGFGAGSVDGIFGPATRAAIRKYQQAQGLPATGYLEAAQSNTLTAGSSAPPLQSGFGDPASSDALLAEPSPGSSAPLLAPPTQSQGLTEALLSGQPGSESGAQSFAFTGEEAQSYLYRGLQNRDKNIDERIDRALAVRVIGAQPQILNDPDIIRRWFSKDHSSNDHYFKRDTSELARKYYEGDEFAKEDALREFRDVLAGQATSGPLRIAVLLNASLGNYRDGVGFPLNVGAPSRVHPGTRFRFFVDYLGQDVAMSLPSFPDLTVLALDKAQAVRFVEDLSKPQRGRLKIVVYLTIDRTGTAVLSDGDFLAEGRLDRVSLHLPAPKDSAAPVGPELHVWQLANPEGLVSGTGQTGDSLALARTLGVPILGDALVLRSGYFPGLDQRGVGEAWRLFLDLAIIGAQPNLLQRDNVALYFATRHLTDGERARIEQGEESFAYFQSLDEFQRRALLKRFRDVYGDPLLARAPGSSFPVIEIRQGHLSEYDFESRQFKVSLSQSSRAFSFPDALFRVTAPSGLAQWPRVLTAPPESAQRLVEFYRARDNRYVYMALSADVRLDPSADDEGGAPRLTGVPKSLTLYADPDLQTEITSFSLDEYLAQPEPEMVVDQTIEQLDQIAPPDTLTLAATIEALSPEPGFIDALAKTFSSVRSANEFDRPAMTQKVADEIRAQPPLDTSFWMDGTIEMGTYDLETGQFQVEEWRYAYGGSTLGSFYGDLEILTSNAPVLRSLAVEQEIARRAVERVSNRRYRIKVRAVPLGADFQVDEDGSDVDGRLEIALEEVYVIVPEGSKQENEAAFVLAHTVFDEDRPPSEIDEPKSDEPPPAFADRPILNQELMRLLSIAQGSAPLSDDAIRMLLAERWVYERSVPSAIPERFFADADLAPTNISVARLQGPLETWLKRHAAALPDHFTLQWVVGSSGYGKEQCHYVRDSGIPAQALQGHVGAADAMDQGNRLTALARGGTLQDPAIAKPVFLRFTQPLQDRAGCHEPRRFDRVLKELRVDEDLGPFDVVVIDRLPLAPRSVEIAGGGRLSVDLAEIDVALERVELVDGPGGLPHVRLLARFEEARYLSRTGNRQDGAPEFTLVETYTPADLEPRPGVADRLADALNVLDISLGMDFEDADRLIRDHMAVGAALTAERPPAMVASSTMPQPLRSARIYFREDGREYIVLFDEPPLVEGKVVGVMRHLALPQGSIPMAGAIAALRRKYGPEDHAYATYEDQPRLFWGDKVAPPAGSRDPATPCHLDWSSSGIPDKWMQDGAPVENIYDLTPWTEVREAEFLNWPNFQFNDTFVSRYGKCGIYLSADYSTGRADSLRVLLLDISRYVEAYQEASKPPPSAAEGQADAEAVPDLDLRL